MEDVERTIKEMLAIHATCNREALSAMLDGAFDEGKVASVVEGTLDSFVDLLTAHELDGAEAVIALKMFENGAEQVIFSTVAQLGIDMLEEDINGQV